MKMVSAQMEELLPEGWKADAVAEIIRAVMEGRGKGYRPALLLLMGRLGPDYPACSKELYRLGALVEFIHMASLIHDDIIDDSVYRRGIPTIQARFGKEMAVYTGDLILGQVMNILLRERRIESGILLAQTVQDMCCGEINQDACVFRTDMTEEAYYRNIYGKTASMFVSVCKIGGIESGCEPEMIDKLGEIGLHLGYLFQIRDDLLDFSSKSMEDGKPVRMDFRNGILTLPVIYTLEDPACRTQLVSLIERAKEGRLQEEDIERLDRLIVQADGFNRTRREAQRHIDRINELIKDLHQGGNTIQLFSKMLSLLKLPKTAD